MLIIPFRDHNPSRRRPYVTFGLIALNILIYFYTEPDIDHPRLAGNLFYYWALTPARVTYEQSYYTLLTSMFLHADIFHLAGNMLFLYIFGDNLEDTLGHVGYLLFYLVCGVGAGFCHYLADPSSLVPCIGASGATAAVMGGYLLLFPKARIDVFVWIVILVRVFSTSAWVCLGIWFAMQVFGIADYKTGGAGVAYWSHFGGFLAGFLVALPVWIRLGGKDFWDKFDGRPPHEEAPKVSLATKVPTVRKRR